MKQFWLKPLAPLALGIAACAACCAAPIAAIVVGAGAASALTAILEPLAGVLLFGAAILTISIFVRRRRVVACAVNGACGCAPAAVEGNVRGT